MKTNDLVLKNGEVMNTKKDFRELMKATKAELHKLGFVANVIATNCNIGFFEATAEGKKIVLSERTKNRLKQIIKDKETVKRAIISYFPRIKRANGDIILTVMKTYRIDDRFNRENNTINPKVLESAITFEKGDFVLQKGYIEKEYKTVYDTKTLIIYSKTAKSTKDGNTVATEKVFHKKEKFSIDEASEACIAYAQSDVELFED